jgi:hypothetical protein
MRRPALVQDAGKGRARKRQEALSQLQQLRLQSRLRARPNWQRLHARIIRPQMCWQEVHLKLQEATLLGALNEQGRRGQTEASVRRLRATRAPCGQQEVPPDGRRAGACAVTVAAAATAASASTVDGDGVCTAAAAVTFAAGCAASYARAGFCRGCCRCCSSPAHWQHRCHVGCLGTHYDPLPRRSVRPGRCCSRRRRGCSCVARCCCGCSV